MTTLEEVFLKVGHGDDSNDDKQALEVIQNVALKEDINDDYSVATDHETGFFNILSTHFSALFKKRLDIYKRNVKGLVTEILIPLILVLIGLGLSKVSFFSSSPDRELSPSQYPLKQRIIVNGNIPFVSNGLNAASFY